MKLRQAVVAWGLVLACAGGIVPAQAARLADGTAVHVRLTADLVSSRATVGSRVDLEVAQPITLHGVVVIPPGAVAWGAVQVVKKGKTLHFDIEGVRLPNQQIAKLRVSPQKTTNVGKDEIKVETQVGGELGAPKGSEFTAYLDQDVNVDGVGAPAPVVAPAPATVVPPSPQPETPNVPPAPVAVAAPPVVHPAPAPQPAEHITVECFSEPTGADIMIDEEFHGSTPSILKLPPGNHQIEFRLMGYKPHSQPLNLAPGTGLRTVRMTLEKQP